MADGSYVITIKKNGSTDSKTNTESDFNPGEQEIKETKKAEPENAKQGVGKTIAAYMGKQALQFAISNFGDLTGSYVSQSNLNSMIEWGGTIAMAATGPMGIAAAAVGTAVKLAGYGINTSKQNQQTSYLRGRVGMR